MYCRQIGNWGCWIGRWKILILSAILFRDMRNLGFCRPDKSLLPCKVSRQQNFEKNFWINVRGRFVPSKSYKLSDQREKWKKCTPYCTVSGLVLVLRAGPNRLRACVHGSNRRRLCASCSDMTSSSPLWGENCTDWSGSAGDWVVPQELQQTR